jgi:hypothetical protein
LTAAFLLVVHCPLTLVNFMAVDIGIGDGTSSMLLQSEPSIGLESDGYYWFLHPLFERLRAETGEYIDLYGDASFSGRSLAALERTVADAINLVHAQPATWQVHTGTQLAPVHEELYADAEKARFLGLLVKWNQMIARAKEMGKPVVCFGD